MNEQIISQWFQQYKDDVYHFLVYYTGRQDVEDLVQEVFLSCMKSSRLEDVSKPRSWLITIARNVAINDGRKQKLFIWLPDIILDYLQSPSKTPEEAVQLDDELQGVYEAMQQLKRSYRDVIILREVQGLSVLETATILGWTPSKVNITLHRALKKLRDILKQEEGSDWLESRYESR